MPGTTHVLRTIGLGSMRSNGQAMPDNEHLAVFGYTKSVQSGVSDAYIDFGLLYAEDHGVPKYDLTPCSCFPHTAVKGNAAASQGVQPLEPSLSRQPRIAAQAAARVWKSSYATTSASTRTPQQAAPSSTRPDSIDIDVSLASLACGRFVINHGGVEDCSRGRFDSNEAQIGTTDARMDLALLSASVTSPVSLMRVNNSLVGEAVAVPGQFLLSLLFGFQVTQGTHRYRRSKRMAPSRGVEPTERHCQTAQQGCDGPLK
jgi:hypothetical protein